MEEVGENLELEETKNIYGLPIPFDTPVNGLVYENPGHQGLFIGAVDIGVELETVVLAPLAGKVIRVRDDSDKYGLTREFAQSGNVIDIEHANGEISELIHLAKDSSLVKVGDEVKEGQEIAKTGLSGWMTAPHLHWFVFKNIPEKPGFKGLKIRLKQPLEDLVQKDG